MITCRQTAKRKDMSNLWIIMCVLCWYSETESQTVHIVEHKTDWFSAYQTCTMQEGRLPGVNIYDQRLILKDLSDTKNISSRFWVVATYDIMNYYHCQQQNEDSCPVTFYQTITNSSGKICVEWRPCSECNNFFCAYSNNSHIYHEADWKYECNDWSDAFQECEGKNLSLATRENVPFMNWVHTSAKTFWLDDMPQINLASDFRMQDRTCFYSFNGTIHEGKCSDTSMTTVCILVHIVENKKDWFTAYQTCTMQQGRLPGVNIYDHRLQLKDLNDTKNIYYPFWISTTSDSMDCNHFKQHYDLCLDTVCQTIAISSGKINVEWRPCWECNNFSCATSPSEIYMEADLKRECNDCLGAFQECKGKNLSLATRENLRFLQMVLTSEKIFWLDDMPQMNLAPNIGMQSGTCLYSFNGIIHDGNCSDTSITTICILVKTTGITPTTSTVFPSQTEYTDGMTHTAEYSITNKPVITLSTNGLDTTEKTSEKQTKGIWPILGSALGGFVVIIIVILVIIIVLRRRRQARSQIPDLPKKEHISIHQLQDDTCYQTLDLRHRDSANVYCALTPKSAVRKD